jgi:hypothetical protein
VTAKPLTACPLASGVSLFNSININNLKILSSIGTAIAILISVRTKRTVQK